jgi:hypothetical protein
MEREVDVDAPEVVHPAAFSVMASFQGRREEGTAICSSPVRYLMV